MAPTTAAATPAAASGEIPFTVTYDSDLVDPAAPILAVGAVADAGNLWQTASPATVTAGTPVALTAGREGHTATQRNGATKRNAATRAQRRRRPHADGSADQNHPPPEADGNDSQAKWHPDGRANRHANASSDRHADDSRDGHADNSPNCHANSSPSPSPTPTVTPSASPSPSPSPGAIVVSGTLVYREPHRLDITSVARVVVAQLNGDGTMAVVGQVNIYNPGAVPIAFSVVLNSDLNPTAETRLWAVIKDGGEAWTSAGAGIAVATNGAPTDNVLVGMFYRPDLIQAELTGTITGTTNLTGGAWTMTWIVDATSHKVIALDSDLVNGANPPRSSSRSRRQTSLPAAATSLWRLSSTAPVSGAARPAHRSSRAAIRSPMWL